MVKEKIEIYNEVDVYFLIIKDSETTDSGEYTVKAENSFGSTSANFTLTIQGKKRKIMNLMQTCNSVTFYFMNN